MKEWKLGLVLVALLGGCGSPTGIDAIVNADTVASATTSWSGCGYRFIFGSDGRARVAAGSDAAEAITWSKLTDGILLAGSSHIAQLQSISGSKASGQFDAVPVGGDQNGGSNAVCTFTLEATTF